MSARAAIVVTGTELLTGRVSDRNGPWLADRLRDIGVDLAHVTIVGDRPADMLAALEWCRSLGVDLVVTSGGLGLTADDLTATVVGEFCGREMVLDEELELRIAEILKPMRSRWPHLSEETIAESNRKQAVVPIGATILEPVGTAPGLVVPPRAPGEGPTVVVLPGPPRELQPLWALAEQTPAFAAAVSDRTVYHQAMLRLYGLPETEIATTLRVAEDSGIPLEEIEVTTCLRRGEIEIVTRYEPAAAGVYAAFEALVRERHADSLFSDDGSLVDDQVARLLTEQQRTLAVAESCTGGLVAARLTERAGASAFLRGGVVAYSNAVKTELAGVPAALIEEFGAVSAEVALALADGARAGLGAASEWASPAWRGPGRHGREAGGAGLGGDQRARRRQARAPHAAAWQPHRCARARDDGHHAPAAPAVAGGERPNRAVSRPARLFTAAELPPQRAAELATWARYAVRASEGVRRLDAQAMHVTLCFLGSQPRGQIEALGEVLRQCALTAVDEPIELRTGAPVWLPPRRPRALAVELADPDGGLAALQGSLTRALAATLDWEPPAQRFRPHVTVARARLGSARASALAPTPAFAIRISRIAFESPARACGRALHGARERAAGVTGQGRAPGAVLSASARSVQCSSDR